MTPVPPPSATPAAQAEIRRLLGVAPVVWASTVLVLGLMFTAGVADREWRDMNQRADAAHQSQADGAARKLQIPLYAAAMMLRAMQTVFLSNDQIDQARFEQYNINLRLSQLPGQVATAYARRQAEPYGVSYPYTLAAPLHSNELLIGFDTSAQNSNLLALQQARDTDRPMLSAPFRLRQLNASGADAQGVTLRLPVYSNGVIPTSVAERRERELGALAVSLRLGPMVREALRGEVLDSFRVRLRDLGVAGDGFAYDSGGDVAEGRPVYTRAFDFGGRGWELQLQPRAWPMDTARLQTVVVGGVIISVLLSMLLWSLTNTRRRAIALGHRMSARFGESEARFRTLNELLPALVLLADAEGRIVYANQNARARLGEANGQTLSTLFADPQLQRRAERLHASDEAPWNSLEAALLGHDGEAFWTSASIAQVKMEGTPHLLMVATDISEQRELTELLSYQATHDNLTELCNRREFERVVELALSTRRLRPGSASCALLYIDLDQFKLINDVSGHMAGDQLLTQLALTLVQQLPEGDVLARLGGDEFGLLARDVDADGAVALAEHLRECVEGLMFSWRGHTYTISASIGVVVVGQNGEPTLKDLLAWADTACYLAKEHGRNRVHLYREDDETTQRQGEMEWANRVRWAMEQDRLLLDYQEIVPFGPAAAGGGECIELLLRLRDENGAEVLPGTFMPAAERYGLMPMIDRWAIRSALMHFSELHPAGSRLGSCAINLSGASIEDEGLADFILAGIAEFGVPAHKLCFEITETVAVRNLLKVVGVIDRLRRAGCRISLDDFGAGMSSFGYLKNLPVDLIKIDGSFIRDLHTDPMSRIIVSAITQIGHQRGVKVVAEWVSDSAVATALSELGVDFGQGFGLHRPERVLYQRVPSKLQRVVND